MASLALGQVECQGANGSLAVSFRWLAMEIGLVLNVRTAIQVGSSLVTLCEVTLGEPPSPEPRNLP